jgi:hypothetical protein
MYGRTLHLVQQSHQLTQPGDEHPTRNIGTLDGIEGRKRSNQVAMVTRHLQLE